MDERLEAIKDWLDRSLALSSGGIAPASSDASFRRYFRVHHNNKPYIVMDAPPENEDCDAFIRVARAFGELGLNVPQVLAQDLEKGFLLLTDLGSQQYLSVLSEQNAQGLYADALAALRLLQGQTQGREDFLPAYDAVSLEREVRLFDEWFLTKHLGLTLTDEHHHMLAETYQFLVNAALQQPKAWVHRDYHSRNLMVCDASNPGILDFQDAVYGPLTYDLVSLLKDCYINWPRARVEKWVDVYYQQVRVELDVGGYDSQAFLRAFDLMGVQRHLKAIGIFARLNIRDGKPGYLQDIPRTLAYVLSVTAVDEALSPFGAFLQHEVVPRMAGLHGERSPS